ncbi:Pumilio-like proteiny domain family member 6 [Yarrowia sp. C11]|nr:Pumilio-like proteiny domain family member 6 [Yarrowia sp. C11]KAG5364379.1 Pumilio-like proteiny domain family member 6 [Yarrowia sp. E02]
MGSAKRSADSREKTVAKKVKLVEQSTGKKGGKKVVEEVEEASSEEEDFASTDEEQDKDTDSDSDDMDMSDSDEEKESDDEDALDNDDEEDEEKNGEEAPTKSSAAESHAEQKRLLKERKLARAGGESIAQIKQIWERLRMKTGVKPAERKQLVEEIWAISKNDIKNLILKHDASRIIQTLFKYADKEKREIITKALKGNYYDLAISSYGKYLLVKMLHYGSAAVRQSIIDELHGRFRKLMRHKEGAYVLEDAYRDYSTAAQKRQIIQEFFGAEFAVFRDAAGNKTLKDIIEDAPEKRPIIMRNLNETITAAVNKGSIGFTVIHAAMLEYVNNLDTNNSEKTEFIDLVAEQFAEMVHTNEGSQVACKLLAMSSAKEKKTLLKSLKSFADTLAADQYGHMVMMTAFDTIDDTKSVVKAFSGELSEKPVHELFMDKNGRRPFLYAMLGRDSRYFNKLVLEQLHQYDEMKKATGTAKKDDALRLEEINKGMSPLILEAIANHAYELMNDTLGSQFISEALLSCDGDKSEAIDALMEILSADPAGDNHVIKQPNAQRALRTLIQQGHWNNKEKKVVKIETPFDFGAKFYEAIGDHVVAWATGDGAFVIVTLVENLEDDKLKKQLTKTLKNSKKEIAAAAEDGNKGSKLIVELL